MQVFVVKLLRAAMITDSVARFQSVQVLTRPRVQVSTTPMPIPLLPTVMLAVAAAKIHSVYLAV